VDGGDAVTGPVADNESLSPEQVEILLTAMRLLTKSLGAQQLITRLKVSHEALEVSLAGANKAWQQALGREAVLVSERDGLRRAIPEVTREYRVAWDVQRGPCTWLELDRIFPAEKLALDYMGYWEYLRNQRITRNLRTESRTAAGRWLPVVKP
jgi:hypothetical protein